MICEPLYSPSPPPHLYIIYFYDLLWVPDFVSLFFRIRFDCCYYMEIINILQWQRVNFARMHATSGHTTNRFTALPDDKYADAWPHAARDEISLSRTASLLRIASGPRQQDRVHKLIGLSHDSCTYDTYTKDYFFLHRRDKHCRSIR